MTQSDAPPTPEELDALELDLLKWGELPEEKVLGLIRAYREQQKENAELLKNANSVWRNQQMSTNAVANKLMDLIITHGSDDSEQQKELEELRNRNA